VDDLVITGNNSDFINFIVKQLGCKFSLKDMGSLHYFLGMEVVTRRATAEALVVPPGVKCCVLKMVFNHRIMINV
jgi:hypothetical protein